MSRLKVALFAALVVAPVPALAQSRTETLPPVRILSERPRAVVPARIRQPAARTTPSTRPLPAQRVAPEGGIALNGGIVAGETLASAQPRTPDTAAMMSDIAGVSLYQAGGVSALPAIRGFNDDRNRILLGGIDITSACGNHMNPPLSYIDSSQVGRIEALTTNIPVSRGGDSIGGTIIATPRAPVFATVDRGVFLTGSTSAFYRSANRGTTFSGTATTATRNVSVTYSGAQSQGDNYRAGDGHRVAATEFKAQNHWGTIAYRNDGHLFTLRAGYQNIPYQGFPNQRMDMLGNEALLFDLAYAGQFAWGALDANVYGQKTDHYMNFLRDKYPPAGAPPTRGMPMYTDGKNLGYSIKATVAVSRIDTVRIGNELALQRLDDWWPPVAGAVPGMCCETFWNINGGKRDRLGTYVEWERQWAPTWSTLLGVRNDTVWMDTGPVQAYSTSNMIGLLYGIDVAAFNARSHAKTDVNFDATAVLRHTPTANSTYEIGYTRKTRSPNLYERYAWSRGYMASAMITWLGDTNGYIGNIDLKPEVAHTASISALWKDGARGSWELKVSPYYSYVVDYIDADFVRTNGTRLVLQFANHNAELYGVDVSGRLRIMESVDHGSLTLSGLVGYVRGRNRDTGLNLYQIMPFNGRAALEHRIALGGGELVSAVEGQAVAAKTLVNALRREPTTPAYALLNLRTAYTYKNVRLSAGIENVLDTSYYLPLGGVNYGDTRTGYISTPYAPMPGPGRSVYGGLTIMF